MMTKVHKMRCCRPSEQAAWSKQNGEPCNRQQSSSASSSSSSAADVDVHSAWDNYDLVHHPPLSRRCSDDRCSLLTQWTNSTASLKSCVDHSNSAVAEYRLTSGDSVSTTGDSDGNADRRHLARYRHQTAANNSRQRFVDASSSPQNPSRRKRELAGPAVQRQRYDDYGSRRSRHPVGPPSSSWESQRDAERCRSTQQQFQTVDVKIFFAAFLRF